jgi:hypothetical protein
MPKTTLDLMVECQTRYANAKAIVGTALYRIEKRGIPLADLDHASEIQLSAIYNSYQKQIDREARALLKIANEESNKANSKGIASIFVDAFNEAFQQLYGEWRQSLATGPQVVPQVPMITEKPKRKRAKKK